MTRQQFVEGRTVQCVRSGGPRVRVDQRSRLDRQAHRDRSRRADVRMRPLRRGAVRRSHHAHAQSVLSARGQRPSTHVRRRLQHPRLAASKLKTALSPSSRSAQASPPQLDASVQHPLTRDERHVSAAAQQAPCRPPRGQIGDARTQHLPPRKYAIASRPETTLSPEAVLNSWLQPPGRRQ